MVRDSRTRHVHLGQAFSKARHPGVHAGIHCRNMQQGDACPGGMGKISTSGHRGLRYILSGSGNKDLFESELGLPDDQNGYLHMCDYPPGEEAQYQLSK